MRKIYFLYNYVQAVKYTDRVRINNSVEKCLKKIIKIRSNATDIIVQATNMCMSNIPNRKLCFQSDKDIIISQKSSVLKVVIN